VSKQPHLWTQVADDIQEWLQQEGPIITDMIRGEDEAPFAASISEKQKLTYYRTRFFNPDGSENSEGRAQELQRLGIPGYVQVMHALTKGTPIPTEDGTGSTY
jgi:hypothetical protein